METLCNVRVAVSEIVFLRKVAREVVEFEAAVFEVFQQLPVACSNRAHGCGGGVGVRVTEGEGGIREDRSGDTSHQERREGFREETPESKSRMNQLARKTRQAQGPAGVVPHPVCRHRAGAIMGGGALPYTVEAVEPRHVGSRVV